MAKYRLRKSDEVFEVDGAKGDTTIVFKGVPHCFSNAMFGELFEPVPDEPTVDPAVEKLAKIISGLTEFGGPINIDIARAVLDAGYTPPPEPKVIRVGSRVRHRYLGSEGEAQFIDGDYVTVKWDDGIRGVYPFASLTLIEEGTPRG